MVYTELVLPHGFCYLSINLLNSFSDFTIEIATLKLSFIFKTLE